MLKKGIMLIFLLLSFQALRAGLFYGFGVGYAAKNVYEDTTGEMEREKNVPLLGLGAGYTANAGGVDFNLAADVDFFAMDIIRGNREYVLFAHPLAYLAVPLRIGAYAISPVVGYGGVHRLRYIEERTYLSAEERYVNPADFSAGTMDILYGGSLRYGDWISLSFIMVGEIESLHMVSVKIRTPYSERSVPFVSFTYRGGRDMRTFGLGLLFVR